MNTLRFGRTPLTSLHTPASYRLWTGPCALAWITAALIGAGSPALAQPAPAAAAQASPQALNYRFDEAMQEYERNHWPQAFEAFRQLAEQGHVDAARLVLQMHWQGARLYGQRFALNRLQMQRLCQQSLLSKCPA